MRARSPRTDGPAPRAPPVRKLLLAAAAILVFAGGALVAIVVLTGEPRPLPAVPETIQAPPPPDGAPPPSPVPTTPAEALAPRPPPEPPPPVQYDAAPEPPPPDSWEAVTPVARAGALGNIGAALNRGLATLAPAIGACQGEAAARGGLVAPTDNYTEARDEAPPPDATTTILVLQVESLRDQVRIVEAPVEAAGRASSGYVACLQRVLRGQSFAAAGAEPGHRYRILYPVAY